MYGVSRLEATEDIAVVTFSKTPRNLTLISEFFARFTEEGINIDMISQTSPVGDNVSIAFTCRDSDVRAVLDITRDLREKYPQISSLVSSGNCKIQLYGEEMRTTPGVFARAIGALAGIGAELLLITTSEIDISLLVESVHLEPACKALREAFSL